MEAQMHRPTTHDHHRYEEDPHHNAGLHSVIEGEGEAEHNHDGEKKSVLKKVKDKAKKIKDKIKHGGQGHDEEDYDEETVVASDVHGAAPINEDAFISGTNLPKQTGLDLGNKNKNQTTPLEGVQNPSVIGNVANIRNEVLPNVGDDPVLFKTSAPMEEYPYNPREQVYSDADDDVGVTRTDHLDHLPASTGVFDSEHRANIVAEPGVKIGPLKEFEKDPHAPGAIPPPNYQAKVDDPTGQGGTEAEVGPLLERLGNLHVDDKSESMSGSEERSYTGSHDQFDSERPESTVTGKISAAIADKASSAKNVVASKLGYGSSQIQEGQEPNSKPTALGSVSEYGHKIVETVYGKAAGAGSAIMSKVQGGGDGVKAKESDKGVSVQEYLAEKFSPGDEDKELSKVITDAMLRKKERAAGEQQPIVKESVRIEAVVSDEKAAAGVVDRVKGAIGSWLGQSRGQQQVHVNKEEVSRLQESGN